MIKTCGHVLCKECVSERIQSRSRKCPHCLKAFGSNDVQTVHIVWASGSHWGCIFLGSLRQLLLITAVSWSSPNSWALWSESTFRFFVHTSKYFGRLRLHRRFHLYPHFSHFHVPTHSPFFAIFAILACSVPALERSAVWGELNFLQHLSGWKLDLIICFWMAMNGREYGLFGVRQDY